MKWLSYLQIKRPASGADVRARFALGDRVSVRRGSPQESGSTPYYVRGKSGVVEEVCEAFTNSGHTASDPAGTSPRQSYRMRFLAREVWPELPGAPGETLAIRISEDWLELSPEKAPGSIAAQLPASRDQAPTGPARSP
jgi:nitrile hydratase beta subunit-like protein